MLTPDQVTPITIVGEDFDPRELDVFKDVQEAIQSAEIYARRFATSEPFKNRQEANEAADAIKAINIARRDGEKLKLALTAQLRSAGTLTNSHFKELFSLPDSAERALKQKAIAFKKKEDEAIAEARRKEQERLAREAEEAAEEAQAAAELMAENPANADAREMAAEARQAAAVAAVATPTPKVEPTQLRGDSGALSFRDKYVIEVVDPAAVPDKHKVVSERSIQAEVDAEGKMAKAAKRDFNLEIPGVVIRVEKVAVSR